MTLGSPLVVGPVNAWAEAIVVEGCLPGADIVVETEGPSPVVIGNGPAAGGRDAVPVTIAPTAGQRLVATQTLGADVSARTPSSLAVEVSGVPTNHAQLPPMTFMTHLHECGKALWLRGAVPGALVTVRFGNLVLGMGRADNDGNARLGTDPLPRRSNSITVIQEAPPGATPLGGVPQPAIGTTLEVSPGQMSPPAFRPPIPSGCDSAVRVGAVIDGAEVTVERASDGSRHVAIFDLDELIFRLGRALPSSGDRLYAWQSMAWCEHPPSDPVMVDVPAASAPGPIAIDPLCAGSPLVRVTGLRGGSVLELVIAGGTPMTFGVPDTATEWSAPVPALSASTSVKATMQWCTFSVSSLGVVDAADPAGVPSVAPPLYACGRVVSVSTSRGCFVELWGDIGGQKIQLSPRIHAQSGLVTTHVAPKLSIPEDVWARQLDCGGNWLESSAEAVVGHPHLEPVELAWPLIEGARAVLPLNALSGAEVTIWASQGDGPGVRIGVRDTTRADPVVGLNRALTTRDTVWATQELCQGEASEAGPRYEVLPGVLQFTGVPSPWPVSGPNEGVTVDSGVLECRFATGAWSLTAHATNTDPNYDVGLVVGVSLGLPAPLTFGAHVDIDLAAAGGGLPQGMASKGVTSSHAETHAGTYAPMKNPAFWKELIGTTATWSLLVAPQNYAPVPDDPREYEDEDDKKATKH